MVEGGPGRARLFRSLPGFGRLRIISLMPSVRVLLFARYAELLGQSSLSLEFDRMVTVGELVAHVHGLPGGKSLPERPFVAVNLKQAAFDQRLDVGDEVALLPPMAGG